MLPVQHHFGTQMSWLEKKAECGIWQRQKKKKICKGDGEVEGGADLSWYVMGY